MTQRRRLSRTSPARPLDGGHVDVLGDPIFDKLIANKTQRYLPVL